MLHGLEFRLLSREEVFAKQVATVKDIAGACINPIPEAPTKDIHQPSPLNLKPEP